MAKDLESPDRSNRFFKRPRRHPMPSGPFLGSIFPLTPNVVITNIHTIFFIKSYPYMGAIISDLKTQIISFISLSLSTFLMLKTYTVGPSQIYCIFC